MHFIVTEIASPSKGNATTTGIQLEHLNSQELYQFLSQFIDDDDAGSTITRDVLDILRDAEVDGEMFKCLDIADIDKLIPECSFRTNKRLRMKRDEIVQGVFQMPKKTHKTKVEPEEVQSSIREKFRTFDIAANDTCTYRFGAVVKRMAFRPSNLLEPLHFFICEDETTYANSKQNISQWIATSCVTIAAACLNERTNATIHIGIIPRKDDIEKGEVQGFRINKKSCRDELTKAIKNIFYEDQIDIAKSCIRPMQFIDVTGTQSGTHVIEVDIVAHISKLKEEAIFIKETSQNDTKSFLYRLPDDETLQPFKLEGKQIQDYMKNKTTLSEIRQKQEEKPPLKSIPVDLKKRFLDLFAGGNETLCHEIYPLVFLSSLGDLDINEMKNTFEFVSKLGSYAVFDFDSCPTETKGLYNFIEREEDHVAEIMTIEDFDKNSTQNKEERERLSKTLENLRSSAINPWIFCNGYQPTGSTPTDVSDWKKTRFLGFKEAIRFYNEEIPTGRAIPIFLLFSKDYDVMLEATDEVMINFPDDWILLAENEDITYQWESELKRRKSLTTETAQAKTIIGLPWNHVNQMVHDVLGAKRYSCCKIATSKGVPCDLPEKQKKYLCDLEILSAGECEDDEIIYDKTSLEKRRKEVEGSFFRGEKPIWWNFWFGEDHVKKRKNHEKLMDLVKKAKVGEILVEDSKVAIVQLLHEPGAGGSTSAQQIIWDCRKDLRCCTVSKITNQTCDQINKLRQFEDKSPLPVLVFIDNMDEEKVESLCEQLENQARIVAVNSLSQIKVYCILLVCNRRTQLPAQLKNNNIVILKHELTQDELAWFNRKYDQLEKHYATNNDGMDPKLLFSFNILKENFNREYIKRTVKEFITGITNQSETDLLLYLSFLNTYDIEIRPLPISAFDNIMTCYTQKKKTVLLHFGVGNPYGNQGRYTDHWETRLSQSINILLNRTTPRFGQSTNLNSLSIINPLFSREIFEILKGKFKMDTSTVALHFLESKIFAGLNKSISHLKIVVREIMKKRQIKEDGKKEEFSPLILELKDKEDPDKAVSILNLVFLMTNDPMVAQTLARLFIHCQNWGKATEAATKATELRPDNSFLWDTHGQVYKKQLFAQYEKCTKQTPVDIDQAIKIAKKATEIFRKVQTINQQETASNDAGYYNEIRVAIILLDLLTLSKEIGGNLHRILVEKNFPEPNQISNYGLQEDTLLFLKQLPENTDQVMRTLEDLNFQVKENSFSSRLKHRTPMNSGLVQLRENIDSYFGEESDEAPSHYNDEEKANFYRRRIRRLGGRSLKQVLSMRHNKQDSIYLMFRIIGINIGKHTCNIFDIKTYMSLSLALHAMQDKRTPKFERMVELSDKMYGMMASDDGSTTQNKNLEGFLYLFLFHWPTDSRRKYKLFPVGKLQSAMGKWKASFQANHNHAARYHDGKTYRPQKETTHFFLGRGGNGSPYDEIVSYEELSEKETGKYYKGDALWSKPEVKERLTRLRGILQEDGNVVKIDIDTNEGNKVPLNIPTAMPIFDRPMWNKPVYCYLGFSWAGPKAFDVNLEESKSPAFVSQDTEAFNIHQYEEIQTKIYRSTHRKQKRGQVNEAEKIREITVQLKEIETLKSLPNKTQREVCNQFLY